MPTEQQRTAVGTSRGYCQSLIANASEITADRQEGYDINLVEQGRGSPFQPLSGPRTWNTPPTAPAPTPAPAPLTQFLVEKTAITPRAAANGYSKDVTKSKYTPSKGLGIIIVVAFVFGGVIAGVPIGVIQGKKNESGVQIPASTGFGGGGIGQEQSAATITITVTSPRGEGGGSNGIVAVTSASTGHG